MNIMLDNIIFELQRTGGISVYWRELTSRIQENYKDSCHLVSSLSESLLPLSIKRMLPVRGNPFKSDPFIFHSSYYRTSSYPRALNIVTVHDFTHRKFGTGLRNRFFLAQQSSAINGAMRIICVSNSTKRDLLSFFPEINPQKIDVIYNGVSDVFLKCRERGKNPHVIIDLTLYL